jgi:integrase
VTADLLDHLREQATALPTDGPDVIQQARRRALEAVDIATTAVQIDPTLSEPDRCRRQFDILSELFRQLKPLARQVIVDAERRRLAALPGTEDQIARLGRTNPKAPDELDALSARCPMLAGEIRDAAWPDWDTPRRIRERSTRMLPSPERLEEIAEELRYAVRNSLALSHPDPTAVRLAGLADEIAAACGEAR